MPCLCYRLPCFASLCSALSFSVRVLSALLLRLLLYSSLDFDCPSSVRRVHCVRRAVVYVVVWVQTPTLFDPLFLSRFSSASSLPYNLPYLQPHPLVLVGRESGRLDNARLVDAHPLQACQVQPRAVPALQSLDVLLVSKIRNQESVLVLLLQVGNH